MKQKQNQSSTQPLTFNKGDVFLDKDTRDLFVFDGTSWEGPLIPRRPNPPTPEAIKRAQFVDKTYRWAGK